MNDTAKKYTNICFRLLILACLIMSVIMVVNTIQFVLIMDKDDPKLTDEFIDAILGFTGLYQVVFYAGCAALVLSLISYYRCSKAAIAVRTVFIAADTVLMAIGLKVARALHDVTEVLDKLELTDLNKITKDKCISAGLDKERAEEIAQTLNVDDAQTAVVAMTAAIFISALLYFVLTCTSLHNILKKEKDGDIQG